VRGRPKGSRNKATPEERFCMGFSQEHPDRCWEWFKGTNDRGYGQITVDDQRTYTHRFSYEFFYGDTLTSNDVIMHSCDNPPCVNPIHLDKGTHLTNQRDMMKKGRGRKALGPENGRSKLTPEQALEIHRLIDEGSISLRAIGRQFDIGVNTVIALRNGVTWSHVTGRTRIHG
jgi:DNA-binding CsgD family transcriptional regulator